MRTTYTAHSVPAPLGGHIGIVVMVATYGTTIHSCGWSAMPGEAERKARVWIAERHERLRAAEANYRRVRRTP